jgi:hypothetical protein
MKTLVWSSILSGCLLLGLLMLGCTSNDGATGEIGTWRDMKVGDQWVYTVTGNEGATPLNGVANAVVGSIFRGRVGTPTTYWRLNTPTIAANNGERWTGFFQMDGSQNIQLVGLDTNVGLFSEAPAFNGVTSNGGAVNVANTQTLDSATSYQFTAAVLNHDNLTCNMTKVGREDVTVGNVVFKCYKYTGTVGVYVTNTNPGIVLNMTAWLCPEISGFPRIQVSWNDSISHNYNYIMTSFAPAP